METFDNLETIWNNQTGVPTLSAQDIKLKANVQAKAIKVKHTWTIVIISITVLVLAAYFIWVSAYKHPILFTGLGIMIAMLLLRIVAEYISAQKLAALDKDNTLVTYAANLTAFYNWRKKIHFVLTPLVFGLYITGFVILLPVFKSALSTVFYTYIIISGAITFTALAFFIARQIQKELAILSVLKKNFDTGAGR